MTKRTNNGLIGYLAGSTDIFLNQKKKKKKKETRKIYKKWRNYLIKFLKNKNFKTIFKEDYSEIDC